MFKKKLIFLLAIPAKTFCEEKLPTYSVYWLPIVTLSPFCQVTTSEGQWRHY